MSKQSRLAALEQVAPRHDGMPLTDEARVMKLQSLIVQGRLYRDGNGSFVGKDESMERLAELLNRAIARQSGQKVAK